MATDEDRKTIDLAALRARLKRGSVWICPAREYALMSAELRAGDRDPRRISDDMAAYKRAEVFASRRHSPGREWDTLLIAYLNGYEFAQEIQGDYQTALAVLTVERDLLQTKLDEFREADRVRDEKRQQTTVTAVPLQDRASTLRDERAGQFVRLMEDGSAEKLREWLDSHELTPSGYVYVVTFGPRGKELGEFFLDEAFLTEETALPAVQACRDEHGGRGLLSFQEDHHAHRPPHVCRSWSNKVATIWLEKLAVRFPVQCSPAVEEPDGCTGDCASNNIDGDDCDCGYMDRVANLRPSGKETPA